MPDDRKPLAEIVHETRRAENAKRDRPFVLADWSCRTPEQKRMDEAMAAVVEAEVRGRVAADLKRLADDPRDGVPGVERDAFRDAYLAAAEVVLHGLSQDRSDEKEADRG